MKRTGPIAALAAIALMTTLAMPAVAHDDPVEPVAPAPLEEIAGMFPTPAANAADNSNAPDSFAPCVRGYAAGVYPCDNVDMMSRLGLDELGAGIGDYNEGLPEDDQLPAVEFLNEIWGWTDGATRTDYALVGSNAGMVIVDVSDAKRPDVIGILPTRTEGAFIWRDIKVYEDHAFVVSEDPGHGVQVMDLTAVRDVTADYTIFDETAYYDGVGSAHNIAINADTGYAYVIGAEGNTQDGCAGGLHMLDVSDPTSPTFVGCYADHGYIHDTQCVVYEGPDADYQGRELCFSAAAQFFGFNPEGIFNTLSIVDVTDKDNPVAIANYEYADDGYSHQGWLTPDQRYFLHNDELDEYFGQVTGTTTRIFDLVDLDNVTEPVQAHDSVPAIGHNAYTEGDRLTASNYTAGLRIYSTEHLADGELPVTGYFDVFPDSDDAFFAGSWGHYPYFSQKNLIAVGEDFSFFLVRTRGNA